MSDIHNAVDDGDLEQVKALLKDDPGLVSGKDILGATALHYAAGGGYKGIAEVLLANKANVNAKDNEGWTPLHWATENGYKGITPLMPKFWKATA
jgi:serine/threonine-protein phosphatase 6 regulatory ankyrin repeat subunit B